MKSDSIRIQNTFWTMTSKSPIVAYARISRSTHMLITHKPHICLKACTVTLGLLTTGPVNVALDIDVFRNDSVCKKRESINIVTVFRLRHCRPLVLVTDCVRREG